MARLYGSNDLTHRFPGYVAQLRLCIEQKDSAHALTIEPLRNGVFAETQLGLARCFYEEGRFYSASSGEYWHEMDYDPGRHTLHANLGGRYAQSPESVIAHVIRPILQGFVLAFYRLKVLHGAAVSRGARTFLLLGDTGAGKSTTAIQLMEAGYDLLSDDGPLFTLHDGCAYALSSLDYLHISDDTLRLFPALRPHVVGRRDQWGKWAVSLADLCPAASRSLPRLVTDVVQLRRGPVRAPKVSRLDRRRVLQDLVSESMIVFRARPFRGQPLFRQYSEFILGLLTTLMAGARVHGLEFADHHLSEIPTVLAGLDEREPSA